MPTPNAINGMICASRNRSIGFPFSHKIKSSAAGSVQAVVLLKSARAQNISASP